MSIELTNKQLKTIKSAARKLTGYKRRAFQAEVTLDYFDGSPRKAETIFGWSRETVKLGLNELRTGIICIENFEMRGKHRTEDALPQLKIDILSLVEPESQTDPKFQNSFRYTRMTAKAVRQELIDKKGWKDNELPHINTIGVIMKRLGFRLRRVQKTKPIKRVKETDAIFENVRNENEKSDKHPHSLRISIDTKAKVKIGPFSRRGKSRGAQATAAADHDFTPKQQLVPFGILDVLSGQLMIVFGFFFGTSDFIVDCLQLWWDQNKNSYSHITQLVINLDNGPEIASNRRQFIKRILEFADKNNLQIILVYYPPYYSKYNPIERCWGILEMHWNGALLDSVESAFNWASSMTWKGLQPVVQLLNKVYNRGVSMTKAAFEVIEKRLVRDKHIPKYSVHIKPIAV